MNNKDICKTILIIDDDRNFCLSLTDHFAASSFTVLHEQTAQRGLDICRSRRIDLVLLDEQLPDRQGHLLCPDILIANEQCKIIFITAHPSFEHAVKAIKAGAYNYLSKPFDLEALQLAIQQACRTMELENIKLVQSYQVNKSREDTFLIGTFGNSSDILQLIQRAAEVTSPVLITGETGTGKNVVARVIHYNSRFHEAPFISINCAALPENLIEAELFGHEKGAFTGAVSARKGLFELAEGGTLFLDEIGSMPIHLQSKLLSVLDDSKIRRIGGQSQIPLNVRIIAATNANLKTAIENHTLREDLFYRLSVLQIHVPPLRERRQDIVELCHYFIQRISGNSHLDLPDSEMQQLLHYHWPGNVRELRNILERSIILHKDKLRPASLLQVASAVNKDISPCRDNALSATLEQVSQEYILRVLRQQEGNLSRTAKILAISLSTLKRKVKPSQSS